MSANSICPLCKEGNINNYYRDKRRDYWQCQHCYLVFVGPDDRLSAEREKAEYDLHQNSPDDKQYRAFLNRLFEPMQMRLPKRAKGLDFGCGPGPALPAMFEEAGFEMSLYDIFYANDAELLQQHYDFIVATEVVEHLFEPGPVLQQLWSILRPGGYLGLMTKLVIDVTAFSRWHYKNDPTHVCFFSVKTFNFIAQQLGAELRIIGNDVILLHKPAVVTDAANE